MILRTFKPKDQPAVEKFILSVLIDEFILYKKRGFTVTRVEGEQIFMEKEL